MERKFQIKCNDHDCQYKKECLIYDIAKLKGFFPKFKVMFGTVIKGNKKTNMYVRCKTKSGGPTNE